MTYMLGFRGEAKTRFSMTLFANNCRQDSIFTHVLEECFHDEQDSGTPNWLDKEGTVLVPTVAVALPSEILVDLIIVAGIKHDWRRRRGRPYPAYWIAGGAVLVEQLLRTPISTTAVWDEIAVQLMHVSG